MNEDKITLPNFLIADLYKGSLVDLADIPLLQKTLPEGNLPAEAAEPASLSQKIKYLGENVKNITIVVNDPDSTFLNKVDHTFLSNILRACRLNPADIAIVNTTKQQVTYTEIKQQLNALRILLFDVEPSLIRLPFKIPPFQVQNYDSCTILTAPALSALNKPDHEGKLLKTKLWNSLKQLFDI